MWENITIVTSCSSYGKYLPEWTASIIAQSVRPGCVCLFTHGSEEDARAGQTALLALGKAGIITRHDHDPVKQDFGVARNRAVAMSNTEWVLHLDADDSLQSHAMWMCRTLAPSADVISAGYTRTGQIQSGVTVRNRIYQNADGQMALDQAALCSSNSPFRRSFWEKSPYRTDLFGAWDTAFWIGLAHLGARFRATPKPIFNYRQHADSIFSVRQKTMGWVRVHTNAMLRALRRNYSGVDVLVPRDFNPSSDRARNWDRVAAHYALAHPDWTVVEGRSSAQNWSKGEAIQDALNHSRADVIVIADADCLVNPMVLKLMVDAVQRGAPWAVPHKMVRRLTAIATTQFLPSIPEQLNWSATEFPLIRDVYEGVIGGGILVIKRVLYEAMGGIPLVFKGWGSEDRALGMMCSTLLGPCVRGNADLLHLYHEPQPQPNAVTATNLRILQRIGGAAHRGKDDLVVALATLNKQGWAAHVPNAKRVVPIDHDAITERRAAMGLRRGRIP